MKFFCLGLASFLILAGLGLGQQQNQTTASLVIDNQTGPPAPINVTIPRGQPRPVAISGLPNQPFVLYGSPTLLPSGIFWLGGLVDINPVGFWTVLNGLTDPSFNTTPTGTLSFNVTLPNSTAINSSAAFQAVVADPSSPFNASLTAATRLTVSAGITTTNLTVSNNSFVPVNLATYGITFPYYANTYSTMYVNADGAISFNSGSSDFTPTPTEFASQMPRIAGFWTDLEPQCGGTIELQIDQTVQIPTIQVSYNNMREYACTGSQHTFAIRLSTLTGDIRISHSNFNNAAQYDILVGISPGGSLSNAMQKNLSAMSSLIGAPNEMFHEWFGLTTMPYYTAGFNNPWDLPGRTLEFTALGAGLTGALYIGNTY